MTTLKDLRQSERSIERAKMRVGKRSLALSEARAELEEKEQAHRAKVEEYGRNGTPA